MKKIALIGKSGAGKDTVKKELCNYIGVIPEVSYTTRPPRLNEIHGVDYNFVCEEKFHSLDMIEKVCFRE
jgi:guanylate kinase